MAMREMPRQKCYLFDVPLGLFVAVVKVCPHDDIQLSDLSHACLNHQRKRQFDGSPGVIYCPYKQAFITIQELLCRSNMAPNQTTKHNNTIKSAKHCWLTSAVAFANVHTHIKVSIVCCVTLFITSTSRC